MTARVDIHIAIQGGALAEPVEALAARGRESMNELPAWQVDFLSKEGPLSSADFVGSTLTLVIEDAADEVVRNLPLVVTTLAFVAQTEDGLLYRLSLAAPECLLGLRSGYRIFQKKSGPDILKQLLTEAGTAGDRMAFRLSGEYGMRLSTTQYDEADWAFFERIAAEEGICYWFDSSDNGPLIVFGDDTAAHDGLAGGKTIPYEDPANRVRPRAFFQLEVTEQVVPGKTHLRDYDVRHPDVLIEGSAGEGQLEMFEYPARAVDSAAASALARVRLEQHRRHRVVAHGRSDSCRLQPGRVVNIVGTAEGELDAEYVVVSVDHHYSRASRIDSANNGYSNSVVLVPKNGPPYRPAAAVVRPCIVGAETAIVTGPGGEEIHVNDLAELTIRFPWDRSGITDDKSSTWVRTLQMGMGGSLLIPRVGWEVPVVYYDGDPDRALVLGRTYNAEGVVPYGQPGAKATTTLQSATSPGGGSTNELRMGDDGGKQEMFLHASRDHTVFVGGSATTNVSVNAAHDVGLSLTVGIKSNQTLTVSANQSHNIVTDDSLLVKGARSETVGAVEMTKVTANRTVSAKGAYNELVGALYGIQCNQANVDVTGPFSQAIGAAMAHAAGLGTSESVAGARTETVGGVRTITAAKGYGESVTGAKIITAGACKIKAGTVVTTTTKGAQTTQAGGGIKLPPALWLCFLPIKSTLPPPPSTPAHSNLREVLLR
ncbi:MAG: type VI secretion system tip protein VgrG [Polyangiaceae bacterium]|nr:type VI secretion system tip protein VgrG [Polyangiaceae bacterium]